MTLLALVLFSALFLEHDHLFPTAMANNRCLNGYVAANLGVFSAAENKCRNVDLRAFFALNTRDAECLAVFYRKLLTAGLNNCVTHLLVSLAA